MSKKVLVVAEARDKSLRNVSFEALTAAQRIAKGGDIIAVTFGSDAANYVAELGKYGAVKVYTVANKELDTYTTDAYFQALRQVIEDVQPDAILMPHTAIGKDLAPRIAARLGLVSDVIDVQVEGSKVVFTRPIYAGKAFEKKTVTDGTVFATVRPNNIAAEETGGSAEKVDFNAEIKDLRTIVKDIVRKTAGGVDLSEAKVVISGGRGVKSAEGFKPLQELADVLGGAVGASRGACDAEYCDYSLQIGQTGKVVTPDLYIAAGISGAIQHLAGMSSSKVIVAINKDPEAPIFQIADYGIVGDLFEVVPLLTEEFKKVLGETITV
ncbi:electron transfer flavoprotein subunit alpha/FixB family protein [Aneurinibacillus migulanus]|uniref:electron transfer flavoprotein subunit alpha/FixB family protein n=1 Tax=Aneurinibacillus migulanus TaxID=47500 RepID=UPI0020A1AA71|nr:electron transfer flavoprotein subunit alpha/FixB family protein [Aneurinibacillus migulanus]MCP1355822.1 electron transfer flavoprotein subunit alpha/FixB family protein [Aneurinibacillus migulanus]